MEGDLVNKRLLLSLSLSWLFVRLWVICMTPFFMDDECGEDLSMFLQLVFFTTLISVFFQLVFYAYVILASRTAKSSSAKMRILTVQVCFYLTDYLVYGLCRFAIFVAGAVWLYQADDCYSSSWYYSLALVIGYFGVLWLVCWSVVTTIVLTWWDSYTL
jgi:hypothetical protein